VTKARALVRPRSDCTRIGWRPDPDVIAVADDTESFAAVTSSHRSVATFHYLNRLDMRVRGRALRDIQWFRAERRAAREAVLVTTYSDRVAGMIGPRAHVVPIAYPVPEAPSRFVEQPVAGLIANWRWPPNRRALDDLLAAWPDVRSRVPAARLLLAGVGSETLAISSSEGVELLGRVGAVAEFWDQVGVLAFPAPSSSGPKVKTLEALAFGVPVVTTEAGVEGIALPARAGSLVTTAFAFVDALASVLGDPVKRGRMAAAGREGVMATHAPRPAARARATLFENAFGAVPPDNPDSDKKEISS